MAKTIVKEIIIILLLCLAIILVLGILLYKYVPMTKTVPTPVSYTTPEEVKQELSATGDIDESKIVMTYEIDSTDLNNYKRIQDYKPGKSNPFSSYEKQVSNGTNTTTNNTTNGTANQNNTSGNNETPTNNGQATSGENTSQGFYPDKGTK
ncbi:MAG: hypothetical protein HFJ40_07300 [Clostridia bacterium]|nr:hypothetical protein [Clostridia bacterium]